MALAIRFRSAVALLGGFPVLAGVDLDVGEGDVVALQGANGSGKTSLLRACAGLLPIVSGGAEVLGHDLVVDRRTVRRHIGLLGHATSLYDDLSVEDNVRFAVRASGGSRAAVGPALERLGLSGRLRGVAVSRLSAGQRRRTALAVVVARDPLLWLLDEPHAGLDAEHRDLLDELIRDATGRGATVVLASHEHERAIGLAGRIVVMAGGQASVGGRLAAAAVTPVAPVAPVGPVSSVAPAATGSVEPATGLVEPATGLVEPATGLVEPATGSVERAHVA